MGVSLVPQLSRDTSADLKSQTDEHVQFLAHQTCVEGGLVA